MQQASLEKKSAYERREEGLHERSIVDLQQISLEWIIRYQSQSTGNTAMGSGTLAGGDSGTLAGDGGGLSGGFGAGDGWTGLGGGGK